MDKDLLKTIHGLLIDITGVLYESGDEPKVIAGSIEALKLLDQLDIKYVLCTNETQKTTDGLIEKLGKIGYSLTKDKIIAPAPCVVSYLTQHNLRPLLLIHNDLKPEFDSICQDSPNCIVIGDSLNLELLDDALQLLLEDKSRPIISMGKSRYYQENGKIHHDLGFYTAGFEYCSNREAIVIGKPAKEYFIEAYKCLECDPSAVAMIGDDIISDIQGAQNSGLKGVLVRTGKFREIDENHPVVKPDLICDNLLAFIKMLQESRGDSP